MKVKCEYCESFIDDSEDVCPNCGAVNENMKRVANGVPTTIEQLKEYVVEHNLPITMMRFYIGEDYGLPKAFGIYKDETSGEFIVYKNKADGTRAIRYQGCDEAYAVNEIYLKLQSEMQKQNARKIAQMQSRSQSQSSYSNRTSSSNYSGQQRNTTGSSAGNNNSNNKLKKMILIIVLVVIFGSSILEFLFAGLFGVVSMFVGSSDYDVSYSSDYDYDSNYYDDDYDYDYNYDYDYDYDSDYDYSYDYDSGSDWDTDWDSDWDDDWDSGSDWDSGYSDWDSDW